MAKTLIFGGTGSLGRRLIERMLPDGDVAVYSRDEAKHWTIQNELSSGPLATASKRLRFYVGDVRDPTRAREVIRQYKPDTVIIAAALKQVDTCELSPDESVKTNLIGAQNIVDAVNAYVEISGQHMKVLFVSTDKACAPVNVYGMCKAISERIVTSQSRTGASTVKFLATRYGNVLESRGSIIPLFKHQGMYGECLTVTDPNMTRFLMSLDDSVDLILTTLRDGKSGETWIPRLPSMRVGHLAEIFSKKYGKPIKIIGLRPGEKQDEDLINESESIRARHSHDQKHYIIDPAYNAGTGPKWVYSSDHHVLNCDELEEYLNKLGIIDAPMSTFVGQHIEEIPTNRKE